MEAPTEVNHCAVVNDTDSPAPPIPDLAVNTLFPLRSAGAIPAKSDTEASVRRRSSHSGACCSRPLMCALQFKRITYVIQKEYTKYHYQGAMLMVSGERPVPVTHDETAIALRRMALLQLYPPKYLLAPEMAMLLHYLPDERQHTLYATLWNTGARITKALTLTPEDLQLNGPRLHPAARTKTMPAGQGTSRSRRENSLGSTAARYGLRQSAPPLSDLVQTRALFDVSRKNVWLWRQSAVDRPEKRGLNWHYRLLIPKRCGTVLRCLCSSVTFYRKWCRLIWAMNAMKARRCI